MKTAIFGGSFDPVHWGHVHLAESCINQTDFKKIIFIPNRISAHKQDRTAVGGDHRLAMLKLALEAYDWAEISNCELARDGVSWTIDTIRYLKKTGIIEGKPGFIIGDDLLSDFSRWREYEAILQEVDLIVGRRLFEEKQKFPWSHHYLNNPIWTFSSTRLKLELQKKKGADFVPLKVFQYIKENGLYFEKNN